MCKLKDNNRYTKPETEIFIAYKVFHYASDESTPISYAGDARFKIGVTVWDESRAKTEGSDQLGFQMFANKKSAMAYAVDGDFVARVIVNTKDIARVGSAEKYKLSPKKAYEVTRFELTKKNWKKRTKSDVNILG